VWVGFAIANVSVDSSIITAAQCDPHGGPPDRSALGHYAFAESDELRQAMQKAGVVDKPGVYFLQEIEKVTV
jgi:hypothetical protein